MKNLKNNVQLIGNLGKDIDLQEFESGKKRAKFSLATNEYYKDANGEKVQNTYWHNIIAWGKTAEHMSGMLKKGSQVMIHGKLVSRSYEDKDGTTRYTTEVVANDFISMSKPELPF